MIGYLRRVSRAFNNLRQTRRELGNDATCSFRNVPFRWLGVAWFAGIYRLEYWKVGLGMRMAFRGVRKVHWNFEIVHTALGGGLTRSVSRYTM
ncbi:hypothetical protein DPMN_091705 [Dreissena polymorpha]|uniref:Uncharacterized protein n=1 Tax=Dreissena polymorpha TaxID=45954 RepID=A0A9D4L0B5_DREPO|nr:hypothetical protein DPMN_091705 [Dreissena polymorpha]